MAIEKGDTVTLHYTGTLEDGTVFDSSREREPFRFTLGEDSVIPGFRDAVIGEEPGQTLSVDLEPDDAYGPRRDDRVFTVSREQIPDEVDVEEGKFLQAQTPSGPVTVKVVKIEDEQVELDGNHPLAGERLSFEIEILDVAKAEA